MEFVRKIFNKYNYRKLIENQNELLGRILIEQNKSKEISILSQAEFKVYSQWGDDGIIQYLVNKVNVQDKIFVEFGVENYLESNTRFLLKNNNWSGLVIDGSNDHIEFIKKDEIYWKYDLTAVCSFIDCDNINNILEAYLNGKSKIGLLSIDIDGNDYWIWNSIKNIKPDIVVCEYNSLLGVDRALTIPYKSNFVRGKEYNILYAGCSLLALCDLAEQKGYNFIGSNSAGNNAYFVIKEKSENLLKMKPSEGYVESKFRELRIGNNYLNNKERLKKLMGLPFYDIRKNEIVEF